MGLTPSNGDQAVDPAAESGEETCNLSLCRLAARPEVSCTALFPNMPLAAGGDSNDNRTQPVAVP
jgi:hypothetical protein